MKAAPLLVSWHNDNAPVYSAHFDPHGKGRLATAGGDNNVRLWKVEVNGEERKVTYLSTLVKHTQAVNVVRWCPRGDLLASAGDDGNILLWVPSEQPSKQFGEDGLEDKESWRVKHMCRSFGSEIYDLAWSPDGLFFIAGSMDNIARIYNSSTGQMVRQIAEHNHYVQGVAWDPLNEFVATQSSDRSVHIYTLKTKDGQFSLAQHHKVARMDLPARRISASSPAPPEFSVTTGRQILGEALNDDSSRAGRLGSPIPSQPGTPNSTALSMNPPPTSHSRRSSFGSSSVRRSVSPSPSLPLPAVMPSRSPLPGALGARNTNIYANETLTSFFRRLTFAPDGNLLFTPAGQYKTAHAAMDGIKQPDDVTNTVYIYTRAGLNKPPVAYLPGHKKPSVAVKCSPVYYTLRQNNAPTRNITIDTSSAEDLDILPLPEPIMPSRLGLSNSMNPPPVTSAPSPSPSAAAASPRPSADLDRPSSSQGLPSGPPPAFNLPYRMIYAVSTQDAVHVYDTQQQTPLCVVSNLHFATFTDMSWSTDGLTLLMTSSDGFCSALTFTPGELGQTYHGPLATASTTKHQHTPAPIGIRDTPASNASTPTPTPTRSDAPPPSAPPPMARQSSNSGFPASPSSFAPAGAVRPASPARSMSASSIASSLPPGIDGSHSSMPSTATPSFSAMPSVAAANSTQPVASGTLQPTWAATPPMTPMPSASQQPSGTSASGGYHSASSSVSGIGSFAVRRESESENEHAPTRSVKRPSEAGSEEEGGIKKRRIAPTLIGDGPKVLEEQPPTPAESAAESVKGGTPAPSAE